MTTAKHINNCYLGIDIGTTGCRIIAIDDHAHIIQQSAVSIPPSQPNSSAQYRQDPLVWWQACEQALQLLLPTLTAYQVQSLAIDATSGTVLLCDTNGQALTDGLMYNDVSCQHEAILIKQYAPPTSATLSPSSGLAKCLFLNRTIPASQHFFYLNQADWIATQFSGIAGISDINNALKMGYDSIQKCWPDWITRLPISAMALPTVYPPGTPLSLVTTKIQQQFAFKTPPLVVSGTTDSVAAFIATGANQIGDAVTSLGTTLAIKVLTSNAIFEPSLGVYSHYFGDQWLCGGASNTGGGVLRHYFSTTQIDQLTQHLKPDQPTGLNYYPLIQSGERFPYNDPTFAPQLHPRPADDLLFFQGMLEGIARIEKLAYDRLTALGAPYPSRIITLGGGATNSAWQQIRATILGCPVEKATLIQAAYGSAILAKQGFMAHNGL